MKTVTVILALAALAATQALGPMPKCARLCLVDGFAKAGCTAADTECQCSRFTGNTLAALAATCLSESCSPGDLQSATDSVKQYCPSWDSISIETGNGGSSRPAMTRLTERSDNSDDDYDDDDYGGSFGGLSTGAKIGIGVGVGVGVLALIAIIVACCIMRKRKRKAARVISDDEMKAAAIGVGAGTRGSPDINGSSVNGSSKHLALGAAGAGMVGAAIVGSGTAGSGTASSGTEEAAAIEMADTSTAGKLEVAPAMHPDVQELDGVPQVISELQG